MPITTHLISGSIGVPNGTVSYSGAASGSVSADSTGAYTIGGLSDGTYTVTPSIPGGGFSPASKSVVLSGANQTGINFAPATITPAVSASASLGSPLITPGWPLASVAASNPIAGSTGTSPTPNSTDASLLATSAAQAGLQSGSVV